MTIPVSAADAASAVAQSLLDTPTSPVVVQWQLSEFPASIARRLVEAGYAVVWAYPSAARGDVAEAALKKAGFAVRRHFGKNEAVAKVTGVPTKYLSENRGPFEQPRVDPVADRERRKNLSDRAKVRLKALCDLADMPIGAPEPGCVTLISMGMLLQPGLIVQLTGWPAPIVLFDHPTSLNLRWKDVREGSEDFALRVVTVAPEKYLPAMLLAERIPQVFVMRDEWACRLASTYFSGKGIVPTEIVTEFKPRAGLQTATFATDLVHSPFAATTFLSLAVAGPPHQLVGQATIGGMTPDSLSMSGARHLSRAVMKVSYPQDEESEVMRLQVKVSIQEYAAIRARDHIRAAMLAFKEEVNQLELVVLISPTLATAVESLTNVAAIRMGKWGQTGYSRRTTAESVAPEGTAFQHGVLKAVLEQRDIVTDGRRYRKVFELIANDQAALGNDRMVERLVGLAMGLTRIAGDAGLGLDLSARYEDSVSLSDRSRKVVGLFSHLLDDCYPWTPYAKGADAEKNLLIRKRVISTYRARRAKDKVPTRDQPQGAEEV